MSITEAFPTQARTISAPVNDGDAFTGGSGRKFRLAPTVSWSRAKVGQSFNYILLPAPDGAKGPAHDRVEQTDLSGEVKRYKNGDAKFQYELTLATDLTDYDLLSDNAIDRKKQYGEADDGARVLIIKWPNEQDFIAAVRATGSAPEVGAYGTVTLTERRKNQGGQPSPIFQVTYNQATEQTLAKAQQIAGERAKAREARSAAQQSAAIVPATQKDPEPPF